MSSIRRLLPFAALVLAAGCAPPPPPPPPAFDAGAEGDKLLKRDVEWAALATTGKDADTVASYWSTDAVLYPDGQPLLKGRVAIRAFVAESYKTPGFKIHWVSEKPTFSPDGKLAYMPATEETTVPGPKGALMTIHGRGISIWRKDPDGVWRCVVDIANNAPAGKL